MASKTSVRKCVEDKEVKELVLIVKAKDHEITKLNTKIRRMEEYHKKELKTAQDKKDGQVLQVHIDENKRTEVELHEVMKTLEDLKDKFLVVKRDKTLLANAHDDLTGKLSEKDRQLLLLRSEGQKCISRVQISVRNIQEFFDKEAVDHGMQSDHTVVVSDLECLRIQLKAFESLQQCGISGST